MTKTLALDSFLRAGSKNVVEVLGVNYWEALADPACSRPPVFWGLALNPAMVIFRADLSFDQALPAEVRVLEPLELGGHERAEVAVLSTPQLNAATIDPSSVCFGSAADPLARSCAASKVEFDDISHDGSVDLVLRFDLALTGIVATDTQACLTGRTFAGVAFQGCAPITVADSDKIRRSTSSRDGGRAQTSRRDD